MSGRVKRLLAISAAALILAGCNSSSGGNNGAASRGGGGSGSGSGIGTGKPPSAGPPQKVHLVWQAGAWKVSFNGGGLQNPNAAKITLPPHTGPTQFVVEVQGPNPPSFKDPGGLDVWEGVNAKGTPQAGVNSTQVLGPTFSKNGKQMIFWDLNEGAPVTLNYRINFETGPSVDPIVDNGGGNWQ